MYSCVKGVPNTNSVADLHDLHNRISYSILMITQDMFKHTGIEVVMIGNCLHSRRCSCVNVVQIVTAFRKNVWSLVHTLIFARFHIFMAVMLKFKSSGIWRHVNYHYCVLNLWHCFQHALYIYHLLASQWMNMKQYMVIWEASLWDMKSTLKGTHLQCILYG